MTNGERVQQALNIDNDCVDVWGENGKMFFSVTQEWWFKESGNEGEWIEDENIDVDDDGRSAVKCSRCGEYHGYSRTNFCPHCGSDMRK